MLNLKDNKIIYELDVDGFLPNSVIAKKVKLSKQVVGYRINELIKKQIIKKVYPILDLEKLGYSGQKVYFQMKNLNKNKEKEIINYFENHPNIIWFGLYEGKYDFVASIFSKTLQEFDQILSDIFKEFEDNISDFDLSEYIATLALKKDYLINKTRTENKFSYFSKQEKILKIDKLDKKILSLLTSDARASSVFISSKINLSADAISKRINKLKKQGIIQGSRLMLNKRKLDIYEFKILLKLKNFDQNIFDKLVSFSKNNKYIVACIKTKGPWNLELDIEIPELNNFHELLLNLKSDFADIIQRIELLLLYDEFKYNFYPFEE